MTPPCVVHTRASIQTIPLIVMETMNPDSGDVVNSSNKILPLTVDTMQLKSTLNFHYIDCYT